MQRCAHWRSRLLPDAKGNKGDSRACRFQPHQWRNPMTLLTQQREAATSREDELLDLKEVCVFFGGIDPSTIYRGITAKRYPAPIKVGPNTSRWFRSECEAALQAMIARRAER
jgi:predicted DNA-binding transcriptional regulator AlpA